jgi:cell division transport system permease protein
MISRPLKEGFRGVGRHWGMSISSAIAVTITLVIISLFLMFSWNVRQFTRNIESSMEISVMVDFDSEDQEDSIRSAIEQIDGVSEVTFSSKEDEFQYYIDSFNDEETKKAFEPFRKDNPMHDAFYVEAAKGTDIEPIASAIQEIPGVAENGVNFGGQSTINMVSAMTGVRRVGAILVLGLTLLAIFLIQNTIKLTISARQDEIRIMRNVGATNRFIRSPFVIEGMITGFMGSIIPIALTIWGYHFVYERTGGSLISNMFRLVNPFPFVWYISGILLLIGIVVGLIGSWISVTRYLRWKR